MAGDTNMPDGFARRTLTTPDLWLKQAQASTLTMKKHGPENGKGYVTGTHGWYFHIEKRPGMPRAANGSIARGFSSTKARLCRRGNAREESSLRRASY